MCLMLYETVWYFICRNCWYVLPCFIWEQFMWGGVTCMKKTLIHCHLKCSFCTIIVPAATVIPSIPFLANYTKIQLKPLSILGWMDMYCIWVRPVMWGLIVNTFDINQWFHLSSVCIGQEGRCKLRFLYHIQLCHR